MKKRLLLFATAVMAGSTLGVYHDRERFANIYATHPIQDVVPTYLDALHQDVAFSRYQAAFEKWATLPQTKQKVEAWRGSNEKGGYMVRDRAEFHINEHPNEFEALAGMLQSLQDGTLADPNRLIMLSGFVDVIAPLRDGRRFDNMVKEAVLTHDVLAEFKRSDTKANILGPLAEKVMQDHANTVKKLIAYGKMVPQFAYLPQGGYQVAPQNTYAEFHTHPEQDPPTPLDVRRSLRCPQIIVAFDPEETTYYYAKNGAVKKMVSYAIKTRKSN